MKSVLFVTHENLDKTAVSKAMFEDVAHFLREKEGDITIFSAGDSCQVGDIRGIKYFTFKRDSYGAVSLSAFLSLIRSYFLFFRLMQKNDIVFFRSYPMILMYGVIARIFRKSIIFDTRGLFFEELFDSGKINNKLFKPVFYFLEILLLKLSNKIVAVTDSQAEYYISLVPSVASKIVVIPNGAPIRRVIRSYIESDKLELVYVGSLVVWHSPELVKDVCEQLERKGIDYHLTVFTKDLGVARLVFSTLRNRVTIQTHDYRNKPIQFHYGFCFIKGGLSKEVCFPVKFLEYVQSGTKVISSSNVIVTDVLTRYHGLGVSVDISDTPDCISNQLIEHAKGNKNKTISLPAYLSFHTQCKSVKDLLGTL